MESLWEVSGGLFDWVLEASWQAAVLAVLVLGVQWLLRERLTAEWRYGLWLLVIARLLIPAFPESPISVYNVKDVAIPEAPSMETERADEPKLGKFGVRKKRISVQPEKEPQHAEVVSGNEDAGVASANTKGGREVAPAVSKSESQSFLSTVSAYELVMMVWLMGTVGLALRVVIGNLRLVILLRRDGRTVTSRRVLRCLERCRVLMGVRTPKLIETDVVLSPGVYGLLRPRLLLPPHVLRDFSLGELEYVFLHELAHLKRRDTWADALITLCQTLHWVNPAVWLTASRMRLERELACDRMVLARSNRDERVDYGETMIKILESIDRSPSVSGVVGVLEDKSQLKRRIEMIAGYRPYNKWRLFGGGVVLVMGLIALTDAATSSSTSDKPVGTGRNEMALTVRNLETDEPIGGARVGVKTTSASGDIERNEITTGEEGRCEVRFDRESLRGLEIVAEKDGFLSLKASWKDQEVKLIPSAHTLRLSRGIRIGGKVVNLSGEPIPGAEIYVNRGGGYILSEQDAKWDLVEGKQLAVTDADGNWSARALWPGYSDIHLRFRHPDYADRVFAADDPHRIENFETAISLDSLKDGQTEMELGNGIRLTGRVLGHDGNPVSSASVTFVQGDNKLDRLRTETDQDGRFVYEHLPKDDGHLLIQSEGHAPDIQLIEPAQIEGTLEVELPRARRVEARVVNPDGEPVSGVNVTAEDWGLWKALDWSTETDSDGRFSWDSAPPEKFLVRLEKEGFVPNKESVQAGKTNRLVLKRALRLSGEVVDAETGGPIEEFRILWSDELETDLSSRYEAMRGSNFRYDRRYSRDGSGGEYSIDLAHLANETWADGYYHEFVFRIEALGYKPFVSRLFELGEGDEGDIRYDVELEPHGQDPFEGIVIGPGGEPVENAQVALITPTAMVILGDQRAFEKTYHSILTTTDEQGRFTLFRAPQTKSLAVAHDRGFAKIPTKEFEKESKIVLERWSRVEGVVKSGSKPVPHARLKVSTPPSEYCDSVREIETGADGRFSLENMPPGESTIFRWIEKKGGASSAPRERFEVRPGETTHVSYGGDGRTVIGKLEAVNAVIDIAWERGFHRIVSERPEPPDGVDSPEERRQWRNQPEIQKAFKEVKRYPLVFSEDGSFQAVDVQPGNYRFSVQIKDPNQRRIGGEVIGSFSEGFTVPEPPSSGDSKPVDLGTLRFELKNRLTEGETQAPAFSVRGLDGAQVRLKDYEGKYVLLDFWATWCGPCVAELPYLRKTFKQYGDNERFAMISLSLDNDIETLKTFVQKNKMPWGHGFLGDWQDAELPDKYGVSGIPATFLISPEGKIISKQMKGQGIVQTVGRYLEEGEAKTTGEE